jgi:hypothetical protein
MENKIISFLLSPELQQKLFLAKVVFLFFSFVFFIAILYFLFKTSWFRRIIWQDLVEFLTYKPMKISKIEKIWAKIKKRIEKGSEAELKLAIIEADKLLDDLLKKMAIEGEILEDKLKKVTPEILPNVEQMREAHKIRNNIVFDPAYKLDREEAKKTLTIYEESFKSLGVL